MDIKTLDPLDCPGQVTVDDAKLIAESKIWENWSAYQKAQFQMEQDLLCMPFGEFHKAMEDALGRPVFTHEFAYRDHLRDELNLRKPTSTLDEVVGLLPQDKVILVNMGEE
jgi:hypothetical protein